MTSGSTANIYFNGGTLQATAAGGLLQYSGTFNAYVQSGGAVIDSNGNIIYDQPFAAHDPALGATADGGLTKVGSGEFT